MPIGKWNTHIILFIIVLSFSSCMRYQYGSKIYNSREDALAAQQAEFQNSLVQIQPFSSPLVEKKLIFKIPSKEEIYSDFHFRMSKVYGSSFNKDS